MIASAQANERIAREQMELGREQFEWAKQNAAQDRQMMMPVFQQQLRIADAQEQRSNEQYEYWQQSFKPLEEKIVADAMNFNTDAERERMAGTAGADIEQAFGNQRAQNARELSRYGLNPNSSSALRAAGQLGDEEALAKAGAMNQSRMQSRAMGMAMAADAANIGRGAQSASGAAAQLALGAGQAGGQTISGLTQNAAMTRTLGNQNFSNAINANTSAGNIYGQDFSTRMTGYGTAMQGYNAKVSADGEFVIPADVVRFKGEEFFKRIVDKFHTPAAQQRKARGL
jgi:hypothetical protein